VSGIFCTDRFLESSILSSSTAYHIFQQRVFKLIAEIMFLKQETSTLSGKFLLMLTIVFCIFLTLGISYILIAFLVKYLLIMIATSAGNIASHL
jgi:hypothetical protein